ncbi:unnamed protein product [Amoebophrya sp. A25]|nr:unnamed protein product [Amoebophrya sp. A25]|eukprot:GSA25T00023891001.1
MAKDNHEFFRRLLADSCGLSDDHIDRVLSLNIAPHMFLLARYASAAEARAAEPVEVNVLKTAAWERGPPIFIRRDMADAFGSNLLRKYVWAEEEEESNLTTTDPQHGMKGEMKRTPGSAGGHGEDSNAAVGQILNLANKDSAAPGGGSARANDLMLRLVANRIGVDQEVETPINRSVGTKGSNPTLPPVAAGFFALEETEITGLHPRDVESLFGPEHVSSQKTEFTFERRPVFVENSILPRGRGGHHDAVETEAHLGTGMIATEDSTPIFSSSSSSYRGQYVLQYGQIQTLGDALMRRAEQNQLSAPNLSSSLESFSMAQWADVTDRLRTLPELKEKLQRFRRVVDARTESMSLEVLANSCLRAFQSRNPQAVCGVETEGSGTRTLSTKRYEVPFGVSLHLHRPVQTGGKKGLPHAGASSAGNQHTGSKGGGQATTATSKMNNSTKGAMSTAFAPTSSFQRCPLRLVCNAGGAIEHILANQTAFTPISVRASLCPFSADGFVAESVSGPAPGDDVDARKRIWERGRPTSKPSQTTFVIPNNDADVAAPQPPASYWPSSLPLREEQLRSLAWMLKQDRKEGVGASFSVPVRAYCSGSSLGDRRALWNLKLEVGLDFRGRGGLLADRIGYGKTATTIALIVSRLVEQQQGGGHDMHAASDEFLQPLDSSGSERKDTELQSRHKNYSIINHDSLLKRLDRDIPVFDQGCYFSSRATLVVVPPALVSQWLAEFKKFTFDKLRILCLKNVNKLRGVSIEEIRRDYDVILCSSAVLLASSYESRMWELARELGNKQHHHHSVSTDTTTTVAEQNEAFDKEEKKKFCKLSRAEQCFQLRSATAMVRSRGPSSTAQTWPSVTARRKKGPARDTVAALEQSAALEPLERSTASGGKAKSKAKSKAKAKPKAKKAKGVKKDKDQPASSSSQGHKRSKKVKKEVKDELQGDDVVGSSDNSDQEGDSSDSEVEHQDGNDVDRGSTRGPSRGGLPLGRPVGKSWQSTAFFPVLEQFYFDRLILDEFHEFFRQIQGKNEQKPRLACTQLRSRCTFGLSGTPPTSSVRDMTQLAKLLFRMDLLADADVYRRPSRLQLAEATSRDWLEAYGRQNTRNSYVDSIGIREHIVQVELTAEERVLYLAQARDVNYLATTRRREGLRLGTAIDSAIAASTTGILSAADVQQQQLLAVEQQQLLPQEILQQRRFSPLASYVSTNNC